ncbi:MAG TPA: metalloregulator ArsR/SmtB family transcription factor [Anaerolineales bacterium]
MSRARNAHFPKSVVRLFRTLGQPARLRILLAIGEGEACVCHLEAALGQRQAYISQNLMALRKEGLVVPRRDGRNIYYRLKDKALLDLIGHAAELVGIPEDEVKIAPAEAVVKACSCPHCEEEWKSGRLEEWNTSTWLSTGVGTLRQAQGRGWKAEK